jgi:hypothetical protein
MAEVAFLVALGHGALKPSAFNVLLYKHTVVCVSWAGDLSKKRTTSGVSR